VQTSFLGNHVRVAIETPAADAPVIVALHDPSALPRVGDVVTLSWAAGDVVALESS
jgi:hypothetical protein